MTATLRFQAGTIEVRGEPEELTGLPECLWDDRTASFRAQACAYAAIVMELRARGVSYVDEARRYEEAPFTATARREPRPFQVEALAAWQAARGRGVVVLPTGAGKSQVAVMAIEARKRSALVIVPTLDLVRQWHDLLETTFGVRVGVMGGGEHEVLPLTVSTYDSAALHMEHVGARFGLVVFDECHHLPSPTYALAARMCLAPFRLGLTATPEREDGKDRDLVDLVGETVYRREIDVLSGDWLAEYETRRILVELTEDQREEYEAEREVYRTFLREQGIRMSEPTGWTQFIMKSARSDRGRRAMAAYRRQKSIAEAADRKLQVVESLLHEHRAEKVLVFTQSNVTAYEIARRFLVPIITHMTKVRERTEILKGLRDGTYGAVATSKVLNEGVDVPDAGVAIVVSGSGSVREHVQRLGRILRKSADKRATLYELVTGDTGEGYTSERRRRHVAYR